MSLGLIVKTGRILTARLLMGEPIDGITHCAIGDGDATFIDPLNPPAPDIDQTALKTERARKKHYKRTFLKDLTVKIYGYDFQPSGEIRFQPVTGAQFSELNLDEYSAIPEGTGIVWEYSTDGGTTWDAIVPAEEENLPNIANDVLLRALFESTAINDSPALNYKDVNLIGHLNNTTGAYISRENKLTQGVESTKVYTQMNIPSGTSLNWFTSNDDGATWEPMSIESTREIDQEWTEYTLVRTFSDPSGTEVRYKAEMTGNNLVYPRIHTLGATLS